MSHLPEEIQSYYAYGKEEARLSAGRGTLEEARTREIIQRYISVPGTILDIGGGAGIYAFWLAAAGHSVHLLDAVPLHIKQAQQHQTKHPETTLTGIQVGDARSLPFEDDVADAVLLLGPLYHLTQREDRLLALQEAHRVLKPGGIVIAAVICRFASMMSAILEDRLDNQTFSAIVERDLVDGQHRNTTDNIAFFTTAYFHHPHEVQAEIEAAGFKWETTLAVEGAGWLAPDFESVWANPVKHEQLLKYIRSTETVPEMMGISPHLIGIGRKAIS